MAYTPNPVQAKAHRAFLVDGYKRGLLYWGRRVGKTLWSVQQIMFSCALNQGPHHIVFKEYTQAEQVAWNQYLHLIPKNMIKDMNKSTLTIFFNYFTGTVKLPNGDVVELKPDHSKPPASLRLLGSDKADSHRGGESYGMILDEYQDQDPIAWQQVYEPFFATTNGWACFMGTAKDIDHWNELQDRAKNNPQWYYSKATWRNNPLISPEFIENSKKEAEAAGQLGIWLQEYELMPYNIQGVVYPMFNKEIHIIKPSEVPDEGTDYIALDFGFAEGHPMAACFIRVCADDIWYQWDEIHRTGMTIDDLVAEIRVKMGDRRLAAIVADSARPDLIEYMQQRGLPVIPSPKRANSIVTGIQLLAQRLKPKIQIVGIPKPNYYITNDCKKTIYDWTHYKYKEIKENRPSSELPEKKFDDSMDAIRYLALFLKYGQVDTTKVPVNSAIRDLNGYGL